MASSSSRLDKGYQVLQDFSEEISASSLDPQIKQDVNRVISCFIYIIENASYIEYAVDHQNEKQIYRDDPHHNPDGKDFQKRVLRDPNFTSFHLALHHKDGSLLTGEEWMQEMQRMMQQLESVIKQLSSKEMRLSFAKKFEYHDKTGCLDARIKPALDWAEVILLSPIQPLDFLMEECQKHYSPDAGVPFSQFAENYLKKHNQTQCTYQGKTIPITLDLLKQYAIDILGESDEQAEKQQNTAKNELEEKEKKEDNENIKTTYLAHLKKANLVRGQQGMLQHRFTDLAAAQAFLTWIRSQNMIHRDKCKINQESKNSYMIRLSEEQLRMITADLSEIPIQSKLTKRQLQDLSDDLNECAIIQSKNRFLELVQNHFPEDISAALVKEYTDKWTTLHVAARNISADIFMVLIQAASPIAINEALVKENTDNWTALHVAACYQSADAFRALIQKASPASIDEALVKQTVKKSTALHMAACNQSADAFRALIQKASPASIDEALVKQTAKKWTVLNSAAFYQSADAFMALIQKSSPEAIGKALPMCADDDENGLHTIIQYQPAESLRAVLNKVDSLALSAACLNNAILPIALVYQPSDVIVDLINSMNDAALQYQLTPPQLTSRAASMLANYIIHEPRWQIEPILSRMFNIIGNHLANHIYDAWLAGNDIAFSVLKMAQPYLKNFGEARNRFEVSQVNKAWQNLIASHDEKAQPEEKSLYITCKSGAKIALDRISDADIELLWKNGLNSPQDYRVLKQILPNHVITQVADDMHRAKLLYIGCLGNRGKAHYRELTLEQSRYLPAIEKGNALIKIIKPENWGDFRKQLRDYNYRADLRVNVNKAELKYKFVHRTGEIVEHQSHENVKKENIATKKQSATLLSKQLNTAVFGDHDPKRTLVGILSDMDFDFEISSGILPDAKLKPRQYVLVNHPDNTWRLFYVDDDKKTHPRSIQRVAGLQEALDSLPKNPLDNLSQIDTEQIKKIIAHDDEKRMNKALFTRDTGTRHRRWTTQIRKEAEKYQDKMRITSYTDFDQFRQETEKHPYKLNEVLRKFTRSGLRAIFFRADTPEARALARQYRDDILRDFKIDLPILYYDSLLHQMRLYSWRQQQDDIKGYNITARQEETVRLEAVAKSEVLARFGNHHDSDIKEMIRKAQSGEKSWQATQKAIDELEHYPVALKQVENIISQKRTWQVGFFDDKNKQPEVVQRIVSYITDAHQGRCSYAEAYQKTMAMIDTANANKKQYLKNAEVEQFVEMLRQKLVSSRAEQPSVTTTSLKTR
jgi:hypothetical protein